MRAAGLRPSIGKVKENFAIYRSQCGRKQKGPTLFLSKYFTVALITMIGPLSCVAAKLREPLHLAFIGFGSDGQRQSRVLRHVLLVVRLPCQPPWLQRDPANH